ncbi:hypothetical protein GGE07_000469 [Sinorhizobium terangae]|nr:hypothetical protein [Sinorhizobium terangae]
MLPKQQQRVDGTGCSFDYLTTHNSLNVVNKQLISLNYLTFCQDHGRCARSGTGISLHDGAIAKLFKTSTF